MVFHFHFHQTDAEADDRAWYEDEESAVADDSAGGEGKFLGDTAKWATKEAEFARRQAQVRFRGRRVH